MTPPLTLHRSSRVKRSYTPDAWSRQPIVDLLQQGGRIANARLLDSRVRRWTPERSGQRKPRHKLTALGWRSGPVVADMG